MVIHHEQEALPGRLVRWVDRGTPDQYLVRDQEVAVPGTYQTTILETLGYWIEDDAADFEWGRPIDYVDLNDPGGKDRILLPAAAKPGDRFVASFDRGSRVWGEIMEWDDDPDPKAEQLGYRRGRLGSHLGDHEICDVSEAGWAWSIATDVGPIRLPGEIIGGRNDPFADEIDQEASGHLHDWAAAHEEDQELVGHRWFTKEDIWTARFRLRVPWERTGEWSPFDVATRALVDGDEAALRRAISNLR